MENQLCTLRQLETICLKLNTVSQTIKQMEHGAYSRMFYFSKIKCLDIIHRRLVRQVRFGIKRGMLGVTNPAPNLENLPFAGKKLTRLRTI